MLFPESEAKATDYVRYTYGELLRQVISKDDSAEDYEVTGKTVQLLLESQSRFPEFFRAGTAPSAWSPRKADLALEIHGGWAAAHMLLIPLIVSHQTGRQIGRSGALRILVQWLAIENGLIGAQQRHLQQIWERYKSVSHLWAAFRLLDMLPLSAKELVGFISLAEALRREGETYMPKRSRDTLLDPSLTWTAPEDFPLTAISLEEVYEQITIPGKWLKVASSGNVD